MSTVKRILDLAKSNLNALLDKAGAPPDSSDDTLGHLSDAELEAELERRRRRKIREQEERVTREAAERAARARAAERAAEAAKRRAQEVDADFERLKERVHGGATRRESKREAPRPPAAQMSDKRLRELYAQLETPYGAPFEEVKKSFRRLMRKYHPDLHVGNPSKHKTATQLTMTLTTAYNELERHLLGRR